MQTLQLHTTLSIERVKHVVMGLSYLSYLGKEEGYDIWTGGV